MTSVPPARRSSLVDPDREALRRKLVAARLALPDRLERAVQLQSVLRAWLAGRREHSIGAYWPIKGEFDPLPALYRWSEGALDGEPRRIGLPVADRAGGSLRFHVWYPGCPTELDAFDIPKPRHGTTSSAGRNGSVPFGFGMSNASSSVGQPGYHTWKRTEPLARSTTGRPMRRGSSSSAPSLQR